MTEVAVIYSISFLIFITEMEGVYCAVQTQPLTVIPAEVRLYTFSGRTRGSRLEIFRAANVSDSTLHQVFPLILSECVCKD